jgi:hypothetical protein
MTPLHQQSSYCSAPGRHGMDMPSDTFPCKAPAWRRAAYVLSHLHLGLSEDLSMALTQVALLSGLVLSLVDLLKVWPRWAFSTNRLLRGTEGRVFAPCCLPPHQYLCPASECAFPARMFHGGCSPISCTSLGWCHQLSLMLPMP